MEESAQTAVDARSPSSPSSALDHLHDVGGQVEVGDLHRWGYGWIRTCTANRRWCSRRCRRSAPRSRRPRRGTASTAITRGRSLAGRVRKNLRTPSAASVVVGSPTAYSRRAQRATSRRGRLGGVEQRHRDPTGVGVPKNATRYSRFCGLGSPPGRRVRSPAEGARRRLLVAGAEIGPDQFTGHAVAFGGEIEKTVGQLVASDLGPPLDVFDQTRALGKVIRPSLMNGLWNGIPLSCRKRVRVGPRSGCGSLLARTTNRHGPSAPQMVPIKSRGGDQGRPDRRNPAEPAVVSPIFLFNVRRTAGGIQIESPRRCHLSRAPGAGRSRSDRGPSSTSMTWLFAVDIPELRGRVHGVDRLTGAGGQKRRASGANW